jgi:hypothetical protein
MSRYAPIAASSSPPPAQPSSRRSSVTSLHHDRRSFSLPRRQSSAITLPDPAEMEAAFDFSDDDDEGERHADGASRGLLSGRQHQATAAEMAAATAEIKGVFDDPLRNAADAADEVTYDMNGDAVETRRVPGSYDFEREYVSVCRVNSRIGACVMKTCHFQPTTTFIPPSSSPPPFQPNSRWNPAQGNSNGIIPSTTPAVPSRGTRFGLLGSMLPSYFNRGSAHQQQYVGGGVTGVFANLAARPDAGRRPPAPGEQEGPEWVPEESQKEGPPVSRRIRPRRVWVQVGTLTVGSLKFPVIQRCSERCRTAILGNDCCSTVVHVSIR